MIGCKYKKRQNNVSHRSTENLVWYMWFLKSAKNWDDLFVLGQLICHGKYELNCILQEDNKVLTPGT